MNSTPTFNGRDNEFASDVEKGAEVEANWGAMYARERGEVIQGMRSMQGSEYLIRWADGHESWNKIRRTCSVNGSPIGVWQTNL